MAVNLSSDELVAKGFYLIYLESDFFSVRSQYLVRLFSLCWITDGHILHPPIEWLLPSLDYRCMALSRFSVRKGSYRYFHIFFSRMFSYGEFKAEDQVKTTEILINFVPL